MKKYLLYFLLLTAALFSKDQPREAFVTVDGMVCAFCASGIVDALESQSEVAGLTVDFDNAIVHLKFTEGSALDQEVVGKIIYDMGYEMADFYGSKFSFEDNLARVAKLWGGDLAAVPSSIKFSETEDLLFLRLTFTNNHRSEWLDGLEREDKIKTELSLMENPPEWWAFDDLRRARGFVGKTAAGTAFRTVSDRHQRIWFIAIGG